MKNNLEKTNKEQKKANYMKPRKLFWINFALLSTIYILHLIAIYFEGPNIIDTIDFFLFFIISICFIIYNIYIIYCLIRFFNVILTLALLLNIAYYLFMLFFPPFSTSR